MRLIFEHIIFPHVGSPYLINLRPEKNKKADLPISNGGVEGLFLPSYDLWHQSFLEFRHKPKHQLFLSFEPDGFQMGACTIDSSGFPALGCRMELHPWLSWVSSLLTADLGPAQLP